MRPCYSNYAFVLLILFGCVQSPSSSNVCDLAISGGRVMDPASGLDQGALEVGFGLAYTPAATTEEFETMLHVTSKHNA